MKISLHRALSQLKLIDAKVEKLLKELNPNGIKQKGKLVNGHITEEDFAQKAQAKFQAIQDLLERKVKLKSAIVAANAKTKVMVGTKKMTIADAITYKNAITLKSQFLATLKSRYSQALGKLENKNAMVEQNLQKVLEATFGKDNVKISKDDVESVRKPFLESNEWTLVDPLKIDDKIEKLDEEINEFLSEVDAVLSEANAITLIDVK